jgi:hypothetical protein
VYDRADDICYINLGKYDVVIIILYPLHSNLSIRHDTKGNTKKILYYFSTVNRNLSFFHNSWCDIDCVLCHDFINFNDGVLYQILTPVPHILIKCIKLSTSLRVEPILFDVT